MTGEMHCGEVRELAPELAAGSLDGAERVAALAHVELCLACRAEVASLSRTIDDLLIATPPVEPPPGFESAVLARLAKDSVERGLSRPGTAHLGAAHAWRRPGVAWVAAVAAALLLVFAGWSIGRSGRGSHTTPAAVASVRTAPMRDTSGHAVGRVQLGTQEGSVVVAVPGWKQVVPSTGASYSLRVTLANGKDEMLGPFELSPTKLTWGTLVGFDTAHVRTVAMVDAEGHVYCSASLA